MFERSATAPERRRALLRLALSADITIEEEGRRIHYDATRNDPDWPAELTATWSPSPDVRGAEVGTLEYFWVERYCLYSALENMLYRARIFHQPWRSW